MFRYLGNIIRKLATKNCFKASIPVISVGNLTLGGSGKTPLVYYLADKLLPSFKKIAILTRGYGKIRNNSFGKSQNAQDDEDFTYRYENVIRIINKNRVEGVKKASELGANLAILDDGFQYHKIHKNIDIVVINPFQKIFSSLVFPLGILRENVDSIKYADIVIINHSEFLNNREKDDLYSRFAKYHQTKIYFMQYKISYVVSVSTNKKSSIESFSNSKVKTISGIGFPSGFNLLLQKYNVKIAETYNFRDHHNFSEKDIRKIANDSSYPILTTEKDILRIHKELVKKIPNLFYTVIDIDIDNRFLPFVYELLKS